MKCLVTGAAGFIGSHLVDNLVQQGHDVLGVDRLTDYYDVDQKRSNLAAAMGHENFEFLESDVSSPEALARLDGTDVVYHLAGQPGVRFSWEHDFHVYLERNVAVTQALLEARAAQPRPADRLRVELVGLRQPDVYPCDETVLPQPYSPYGVTKLLPSTCAACTPRTTGRRRSRCGTSPCTDRVNDRTWPSRGSSAPGSPAGAITVIGDGTPGPRLHLRRRRGGGDRCGGHRVRSRRARSSTSPEASPSRSRRPRDHRAGPRPRAGRRARARRCRRRTADRWIQAAGRGGAGMGAGRDGRRGTAPAGRVGDPAAEHGAGLTTAADGRTPGLRQPGGPVVLEWSRQARPPGGRLDRPWVRSRRRPRRRRPAGRRPCWSTGSAFGASVRSVHSPGAAKNRNCPVADVGTSAVNSPVRSSSRT